MQPEGPVLSSQMKRLQRKDVAGERLRVGDLVRIVGVPDLTGMTTECRAESLPVFEHLVGTYKRVKEFDEFGLAWLNFRIRKGPHAGFHWVGIEPYFVKAAPGSQFLGLRST